MNSKILEYKSKPDNSFRVKGRMKSAYDFDSKNGSESSSDDMNAENEEDLGASILDITKNNKRGGFRDYAKSRQQPLRQNTKMIYKTHDHSMLKSIQEDYAKNLSSLLKKNQDQTKKDQSRFLSKHLKTNGVKESSDEEMEQDTGSILNFNVALRTPIIKIWIQNRIINQISKLKPINDLGEEPTTIEFIDGVHSSRTAKNARMVPDLLEYDRLPEKTKRMSTKVPTVTSGWSSPIAVTNLAVLKIKNSGNAFEKYTEISNAARSPAIANQHTCCYGADIEEKPENYTVKVIEALLVPPAPKRINSVIERNSPKKQLDMPGLELVNQLMKEKLQTISSNAEVPVAATTKLHSRVSSGFFNGHSRGLENSLGIVLNSPNMTQIFGNLGNQTGPNSSLGDLTEKFDLSQGGKSNHHKKTSKGKKVVTKQKSRNTLAKSPKGKKHDGIGVSSNNVTLSKSSQQNNTLSQFLKVISSKESDAKASFTQDSGSMIMSPQKRMTKQPFGSSVNQLPSQQLGGLLAHTSNYPNTAASKDYQNPLMYSENPKNHKYKRQETGSFNFVTDSVAGTAIAFAQTVRQLQLTEASNKRSSEEVLLEAVQSPFSGQYSDKQDSNQDDPKFAKTISQKSQSIRLTEISTQEAIRKNKYYQRFFSGVTINPDSERVPLQTQNSLLQNQSKASVPRVIHTHTIWLVPLIKQQSSYARDDSRSAKQDFSPVRAASRSTTSAVLQPLQSRSILFGTSNRESINSKRGPPTVVNKEFTVVPPIAAVSRDLVDSLTERKRNTSLSALSRKRFSKPTVEVRREPDFVMPKSGVVTAQHSDLRRLGSQDFLASPSSLLHTDFDRSREYFDNHQLFKQTSIDAAIPEQGIRSDASLRMIGHLQLGSESQTLSSIKHSASMRSNVFSTNRNLGEGIPDFPSGGKNMLDCDSLRNLQNNVFKKQKTLAVPSSNKRTNRVETIPTESDETSELDGESTALALDMITHISKARLVKSIRSFFEKHNLRTALVSSMSAKHSVFDGVHWAIPNTPVHLVFRIFDHGEWRYVDYVLLCQPPSVSKFSSAKMASPPLSRMLSGEAESVQLKTLPEDAQCQIHIIMRVTQHSPMCVS